MTPGIMGTPSVLDSMSTVVELRWCYKRGRVAVWMAERRRQMRRKRAKQSYSRSRYCSVERPEESSVRKSGMERWWCFW